MSGRIGQVEKRLVARMSSLEEQLGGQLAAMSVRVGSGMHSELDKRFQSVYDHVNFQVKRGGGGGGVRWRGGRVGTGGRR